MKKCSMCGEIKPRTEFYKNRSNPDGLGPCRACGLASSRAWRKNNRDTGTHRLQMAAWKVANPEKYAAGHLRRRLARYGLTPAQFEALLEAQDRRCAACGSTDPGTGHGQFTIDHDHACCAGRKTSCGGCVRGLLCNGCNSALAHVKDDTGRLRSLVAYLERRSGG